MIRQKAVFGMGICLINNWPLIKEHFNPDFGLDNNKTKQGLVDDYTGLMCMSFQELTDTNSLDVLITAGDPYYAMTMGKQLKKLGINYEILAEKLDEWCEDIELPEHLADMKKTGKKIILFNSPEHDNVGDHLISLSEMAFLEENFKDYQVFEVTDIEYLWHHLKIRKLVTSEDIILVTGGGFLGSLWLYNAEDNVRRIINEYTDNRVIILPQTIFFENNEKGQYEYNITKEIYKSHKNLVLCGRENVSYELFKNLIEQSENDCIHDSAGKSKAYLMPDMALLYKYTCKSLKDKKKALICFRNDKEKMIDGNSLNIIKDCLLKSGYNIQEISMHSGCFDGIAGREKQVNGKLEEIGSAEIVITDTLHCMISAALTGTNCIAFNNVSGKVGNVFKWIQNLGYIAFCNSTDHINELISNVSDNNIYHLENEEQYKKELVRIIRGV